MVSDTISLPSRGTFHLSLTVLVHYRSHGSIQAYPTVRADSHGIPRVPCYSGNMIRRIRGYGYGAITLYGRESNPVRLPRIFITPASRAGGWTHDPTTPHAQPPTGIARARFSHPPLSLATTHGISPPAGTEMFHFPAFPPQQAVTAHDGGWVPPFGNPRIKARSAAPRGLSRPPTSFIGSMCQGIHQTPFQTNTQHARPEKHS